VDRRTGLVLARVAAAVTAVAVWLMLSGGPMSGQATDETVVRGENVLVRDEPSDDGRVVAMLQGGDEVRLRGGGVLVDGHAWWSVVALDTGDEGWVRWEFLAGVDPATAAPLAERERTGDGNGKRVDKKVRDRQQVLPTPTAPPPPQFQTEIVRNAEIPTRAPEEPDEGLPRATAAGTYGDPIPVGQYGRFRDWEVAIIEVTRDADALLAAFDPLNEPRSGYHYVLVEVQETNSAPRPLPGASIDYVAVAASGAQYPTTRQPLEADKDTCGPLPRPLDPARFETGEARRGQVCFEVASPDVPFLRILARDAASGETLWFIR
jgi:hypothetical protein